MPLENLFIARKLEVKHYFASYPFIRDAIPEQLQAWHLRRIAIYGDTATPYQEPRHLCRLCHGIAIEGATTSMSNEPCHYVELATASI